MNAASIARADPATMVVADDHPPFVDVIAERISQRCGVRVVARCADGESALTAIRRHQPAIALLDLRMPRLDGRGVLAEVVRLKLPTSVLVYTAHSEPALVRAVLEDGARGYLTKGCSWDELFAAVRDVAAGRVWVSPRLRPALIDELAARRRVPSPRELEVLRHASRGLTDAQIAEAMYISPETVRTNFKRSSEKLGVSGRTALVAEALRRGLIE